MKVTFNQLIAGIVTIVALLGVIAVIFIKPNGESSAITILGSALSAGIVMFLKAGSDSAHADQVSQMTDALANSAPVK